MFNAINLVQRIPKEIFDQEFVQFLGCTIEFSKLRCGLEDTLNETEVQTILTSYRKLGLPTKNLTMQEIVQIGYALTMRAITARS